MDRSKLLKQLQDIQETLTYEMDKNWDDVPKTMQLDIKESLDDLRTTVYAAFGYVLIHPKT